MRWLSCWHVWGPLPPPLNIDFPHEIWPVSPRYSRFPTTQSCLRCHHLLLCWPWCLTYQLAQECVFVCMHVHVRGGVQGTHRLIFYPDASLSAAHSWHSATGHSPNHVCMWVCLCVLSPPLHCTHTLTQSQPYALICHDPCRISMMDKASSQIIITDPPLFLVGQQHGQNVVLAVHSGHKAWTLAHGL